MLLRASGILLAWPYIARAAGEEANRAAPGQPCTIAVATLQRGVMAGTSADESCRSPSGSTPVFQAASLAKPVVATLALKLALRGVLDLDRPLSEILPDGYPHRQNLFSLRETPVIDKVLREMLRKLTARALLSHTSGLPNWSPDGPLRLGFEPGARWQYSGEGYVLLQHVLQTLTAKPLEEIASTEIFQPLGLWHTAFKLTDQIAPSLVPGHSASGGDPPAPLSTRNCFKLAVHLCRGLRAVHVFGAVGRALAVVGHSCARTCSQDIERLLGTRLGNRT